MTVHTQAFLHTYKTFKPTQFLFFSYSSLFLPTHCRCRFLLLQLIALDDTCTFDRASLNEGSARRRDLNLTT